MKRSIFLLVSVLVISIFIRLYKINSIPGEWYGDISNVHEYEMQVLRGEWPFYFFQSPGPLYHYLIAPIVLLYQNHGFETYKIASIAVSILGLAATFIFVAEISSLNLAFVTVLTMSFSLWYLIWSRLGNSQIVIPALVSFMSLFIAKFVKKRRFADLFWAAIFASLGWYTYPQTFILPALFIIFIIIYLIIRKQMLSNLYSVGLTMVILVICAIPFVNIVRNDKGNFGPQGYVGGKILPIQSMSLDQLLAKVATNYTKVLLMFHVKGDGTFRVNVAHHPQIDRVSGIIFFLGFLYFLQRKRRIWLFYILWMLLLLPIPSISPVLPESEIPNSARTIAVIPFVFLVLGSGFLWLYLNIRKLINNKFIAASIISLIFGVVVYQNSNLYFNYYSKGLPDNNLAPGKIIANYIDTLSSDISVYFSSCCWGNWGQPEPKGVVYQLHRGRKLADYTKLRESCKEISNRPSIVVTDPNRIDLVNKFLKCSAVSSVLDLKSEYGITVAKLVFIQ